MPIDYNLGKIYKLVNNNTNEIYVGSTCEPILARRLAGHVGSFKHYLAGKFNYVTSFKILESGNYDIVLIENCPCESKDELHQHERHYIETLDCVNKYIPNRTQKEYLTNYRITNKSKINEHCVCSCCGGKYTHKYNK
jgi:hypothetical protein